MYTRIRTPPMLDIHLDPDYLFARNASGIDSDEGFVSQARQAG